VFYVPTNASLGYIDRLFVTAISKGVKLRMIILKISDILWRDARPMLLN